MGERSFDTKVYPCVLDTQGDIIQLKRVFYGEEAAIKNIPLILRNKDKLPLLSIDESLIILRDLMNFKYGRDVSTHVLNVICNFDWETQGRAIIANKIHPFIN